MGISEGAYMGKRHKNAARNAEALRCIDCG
jgi:hypothetical protein